MNIKTICAAVLVSGAALAGVSQASAMPFGQAPAGGVAVEQAGWRCGPGWHITRWGRCVPNRPVYARPYYGGPRYRARPHYWRRGW
ncbi:MAG: hypothetical protein KGM42_12020 [Hyphomicrobiales bacterium]|nr:hypothetical protein [Hyphomicrobiales bacterium]